MLERFEKRLLGVQWRKPINSTLLPPRSTAQAQTRVTGSSCETLQILPPHSCYIAAEISTGHYFIAQQQKGHLFRGSRSRWKMKPTWQAFSQRELNFGQAGGGLACKEGIVRKTRTGTGVNQWYFLNKRIIKHSYKKVKHLFPSWRKTRECIFVMYKSCILLLKCREVEEHRFRWIPRILCYSTDFP